MEKAMIISQERKSPQKDQIAESLERLRETARMANLFMKKLLNGDVPDDREKEIMTSPPLLARQFSCLYGKPFRQNYAL